MEKKVKKILLVDDEKFILQLLTDILSDVVETILTASNGKEGYLKALMEKPDIIISDVMMPIMSGYELLSAIRYNPNLADIPFILLTVKDTPDDISKGQKLKATYYFLKPFDENQLLRAIDEIASSR